MAMAVAVGGGGVGSAYACGYGSFVSMSFVREADPETPVPASNDGFVAVELVYDGTEAELEAYVAELTVEVKNADGIAVAGELELLHTRTTAYGTLAATLGWSSPEALPPGIYDVALSYPTDAGLPMQTKLDVLEQTPETVELEVLGSTARRLVDDTGQTVQCMSRSTTCSSILDIGVELHDYVTLSVAVETSKLPAVGAYALSLSEVPGKGSMEPLEESVDSLERSDVFFRTTENNPTWSAGVRFTDEVDEYCVDVTLRNLRTDETYVERACASPDPDAEVQNSDMTKFCAYPPPAEIAERWCLLENDPTLDVCKAYFPPEPRDPMPYGPPPEGDPAWAGDDGMLVRAENPSSGSDGGCSVSGASGKTSSHPWLALGVLGLALVSVRRAKRSAQ